MESCRLRWTRWAVLWTLIGSGTLMPGCQTLRPYRGNANQVPVVFETAPNLDGLLRAINANTAEVRQLSCDVQIRISGVPPLSGTLIVERPRRMRLKAGLIGISELGVDVGSNDEQFWVWSKSSVGGQVPAIYFANHDEFAQAPLRQAIPFEPQSIIDALGLVNLPQDGSVQGPMVRPDGRYELRMEVPSASGPMTKVLVIDQKTGLVQQQSLYDARRQLIAYANAREHQYFEKYHTSLPRRVELTVIGSDQQPNTITVDMAGHSINQLYGDPQQQWEMPRPPDAQWVNLAKAGVAQTQAP